MFSLTLKFDSEHSSEILSLLRDAGMGTIANQITEGEKEGKQTYKKMFRELFSVCWKFEVS